MFPPTDCKDLCCCGCENTAGWPQVPEDRRFTVQLTEGMGWRQWDQRSETSDRSYAEPEECKSIPELI